jgi:uncharacterized protein YndB with AHSA1/START domain
MTTRALSIDIAVSPERVFDLLHDYRQRLLWDPFLRRAEVLESDAAGLHVRTLCVAKWSSGGLGMETEYVAFDRPRVAAVRMTRGPWMFRSFAASIRQDPNSDGSTTVTYRFNFRVKPSWTAFLLRPLLNLIFARETRARLAALKRFLELARNTPRG